MAPPSTESDAFMNLLLSASPALNLDPAPAPARGPSSTPTDIRRHRPGIGLRSGLRLLLAAMLPFMGLVGCKKQATESDDFTRLTNLGKSQIEAGDAAKAIDLFKRALTLNPTLAEAQINLANA